MQSIKVGKKTIFFDDTDGRHHFTDKQGNRIQSVTEFTGILDKPALIPWAVNLAKTYLLGIIDRGEPITAGDIEEAAKQHRIIKKAGADIGTAIHDLVSKWIKNEKYDIPEDEKIRNGFNAFLNFQKEHRATWLESEKIVYSPKHNYAGILDAIAIVDGKMTLMDFKSSNGIWPEHQIQLGGYHLAYEEMTKKKIRQSMIIRFSKDTGDFEFRIMSNPKQNQKAFLACVVIKRTLNNK